MIKTLKCNMLLNAKKKNKKELNFFYLTIINSQTNKYQFEVYRKPTITNVQVKRKSNMCLLPLAFKGVLSQAFSICSQKCLDKEMTYLIDIFTENGH